VIEDCDTNQTD